MEVIDRDPGQFWVTAHLVDRGEAGVAVEGGVLLGLGHHWPAGLGETDHELIPAGLCHRVTREPKASAHHVDDQFEGVVFLFR